MATIEQVSQACNLTIRRVNQLAREGVLPKEGRGDYNLGKCMAAYIRYLQAALAKKATMDENGEIASLQGNRQELLRIQIERERFAHAKDKGAFIPVEAHELILADLIQETKARIRAVGSRIAADLVGEESRLMIQAKLDKAYDEALRHLAKIVPRIPPGVEVEAPAPAPPPAPAMAGEPEPEGEEPDEAPAPPARKVRSVSTKKPKPKLVKKAPGKTPRRGR